MRQQLQTAIQTDEHFQTLLNTLLSDLGKANDYLTLFKNLVGAQKEYWRGMANSPAFWSTTLGALQDAALHGLARAYEQSDDSLTLKTMLKTIESAPAFLSRPDDFDTQQLEADLAFVQRQTNLAVDHLIIWRNKFFAHRDPIKIIEGRTLAEDHPIRWEEIDSLLNTGFTIVNRYSIAFFRSSTMRDVHGHKDYLTLLKTLQSVAQSKHDQLMEEIRRIEEA